MDKLFYSYTSPWTSTSLLYSQNYPNSIIFHPTTHRIMQNGVIYGNGQGGPIFIKGKSTDTAGSWTGDSDEITEYYEGLSIIYLPTVAAASTTNLNINSFGNMTCYFSGTTKLTSSHFAKNTPIMFTYTYISGSVGMWTRADYNYNTNTFETTTKETSTNATYYVGFFNRYGNVTQQYAYVNSNLLYNPGTKTLTTSIYKTTIDGYFEGNLHGNATTSDKSITSELSNLTYMSKIKNASSSASTYYISFSSSVTNDTNSYTFVDDGLKYVPSTNTLTAAIFTGNLNGNASTATNATNATNATITQYTKINSTTQNRSYWITFVDGTDGNRLTYVNSNLIYNPGTTTLSGVNASFSNQVTTKTTYTFDAYVGTNTTNAHCHMIFDNTNKCLNFIFD